MATTQLNGVMRHILRQALPSGGAGLSDGQLLGCFIDHRDEAAFAALVHRHGPMVLGVCRRILGNCHDADDAFQAAFLVLVRKAGSVHPRELVGNWLYGVAYQTARKARSLALKRRTRERQVNDMPEPAAGTQELWEDLRPLLDQELSRLPDKYRVPIVLCDLEGKSGREAARQLGCPEGTLTGRLSRARALLARRLSQRGVGLSGSALALLLSNNAASASVPAALIDSTAQAATIFAAGPAGAVSALSPNVIALTNGVLTTMLLTKLKLSGVVMLLIALVGLGSVALAQRTAGEKPAAAPPAADARAAQRDGGRAPARPEVRGIIKSIDTAKNTITLTTQTRGEDPGEKTYTLAKNVEVGIGAASRIRGFMKEGKLGDLNPGIMVSLGLSADEKSVEFIMAETPAVRGVLKAVEAEKKTITVTIAGRREGRGREEAVAEEEQTYAVSPNAEIGADDGRGRLFSVKEVKLSDLATGSIVVLFLSVDRKQAESVLAEGPNFGGHVKAVDAAKNSLTLVTPSRGGDPEEKTLEVAPNAIIVLDDGKGRRFSLKEGKLADVAVGAVAQVKLSADQKHVTSIRAEGAMVGGRVKSIDTKNNTITIEIFVRRGENAEEKTYSLAKDVHINIEGNPGKLADIKTGEESGPTMLKLSLDQKTVQAIVVNPGRGGRRER
jgi:RNA polymerase sigma factor (sigma-70 family)